MDKFFYYFDKFLPFLNFGILIYALFLWINFLHHFRDNHLSSVPIGQLKLEQFNDLFWAIMLFWIVCSQEKKSK